jgi:transcriptional regulator of aromatic amino acid metabolism
LDDVEKKIILEVVKNYDSSRKAGKVLEISNTVVLNKNEEVWFRLSAATLIG